MSANHLTIVIIILTYLITISKANFILNETGSKELLIEGGTIFPDLDGDGIDEFIGIPPSIPGAVEEIHLYFLNEDGSIKKDQFIFSPNFGESFSFSRLSFAVIADLNLDGVPEISVGLIRRSNDYKGELFILYISPEGNLLSSSYIGEGDLVANLSWFLMLIYP